MDTQRHTKSASRPTNKRSNGRFAKGNRANPTGRPRGSKNKPKTLALTEAISAAELALKGRTPRQIARLLKAKPAAVAEALAQSHRLLQVCAPQFAGHWLVASRVAADGGDHKPAMAALQSIDVVKPVAQTYDTGVGAKGGASATVNVQFVGYTYAGLPPVVGAPGVAINTATTDQALGPAADPAGGPHPRATR